MKKYLFTGILSLIATANWAQDLFDFLPGDWRIENSNAVEHWDRFDNNKLVGMTYQLITSKITISEYLRLERKGKKTICYATVLNQNENKEIPFTLVHSDTAWVFENQKHDFPKQLVYKKISENLLSITIKGNEQVVAFSMKRMPQMQPTQIIGNENPNYDADLAESLNADKYGMKKYFFVLLETGSNTTQNEDSLTTYFAGHMANIHQLVEQKKLTVAGPFGANSNQYRGIFIFHNVSTKEEVEALLKNDPAIENKVLSPKIVEWYGSAALPLYLQYDDLIWKEKP